MLNQEDVVIIKAMSNTELSPVFLRQLRKAMSAAKKKKALAISKTSVTTASALRHNSGVRSEAQTSRELLQPKRKTDKLSKSVAGLSQPVAVLRTGI
jgi:hypothetical protein